MFKACLVFSILSLAVSCADAPKSNTSSVQSSADVVLPLQTTSDLNAEKDVTLSQPQSKISVLVGGDVWGGSALKAKCTITIIGSDVNNAQSCSDSVLNFNTVPGTTHTFNFACQSPTLKAHISLKCVQ